MSGTDAAGSLPKVIANGAMSSQSSSTECRRKEVAIRSTVAGSSIVSLPSHESVETDSGEQDDDDDDDDDDDGKAALPNHRGTTQVAADNYVNHVTDALRCAECKGILQIPILQATCGDRWHEVCFKTSKLREDNTLCPGCNEPLDDITVWRDVFAERELVQLEVYCPAINLGCKWIGRKGSLLEHTQICQFQVVPCANGCQEKVLRKNVTLHQDEECPLRKVDCPSCKATIKYVDIEIHAQECLLARVQCTNGCQPGTTMKRQELNDHLKECKFRMIPCPILDCGIEVRHNNLHEHFEKHQLIHIIKLNQGPTSIQKAAELLQLSLDERLENIKQDLKDCENSITLLVARAQGTEDQLIELSAYVKIKQQEIIESCSAEVDGLQRECNSKCTLVEKQISVMTERLLIMEDLTVKQGEKIQELESRAPGRRQIGEMSQDTQQLFTAQDKVIATHDIKLAEHGLRFDMMDCKNINGVLLWKITDVARRRGEAVNGKIPSIYSQPFYTSLNGYKLCARLYFNGDGIGKGTHLSLFVVLMRGEYDVLLSWPFQHKVTLILVDQDGRRDIADSFRPDVHSSSFQRPRSELNVATGCPKFIPLATLDSGGYIRDNCIFIKVMVDLASAVDPGAK